MQEFRLKIGKRILHAFRYKGHYTDGEVEEFFRVRLRPKQRIDVEGKDFDSESIICNRVNLSNDRSMGSFKVEIGDWVVLWRGSRREIEVLSHEQWVEEYAKFAAGGFAVGCMKAIPKGRWFSAKDLMDIIPKPGHVCRKLADVGLLETDSRDVGGRRKKYYLRK